METETSHEQKLRKKAKDQHKTDFPIWAIVLLSILGFLFVVGIVLLLVYSFYSSKKVSTNSEYDEWNDIIGDAPTKAQSLTKDMFEQAKAVVPVENNRIFKIAGAGLPFYLADKTDAASLYRYDFPSKKWQAAPKDRRFFDSATLTKEVSCS